MANYSMDELQIHDRLKNIYQQQAMMEGNAVNRNYGYGLDLDIDLGEGSRLGVLKSWLFRYKAMKKKAGVTASQKKMLTQKIKKINKEIKAEEKKAKPVKRVKRVKKVEIPIFDPNLINVKLPAKVKKVNPNLVVDIMGNGYGTKLGAKHNPWMIIKNAVFKQYAGHGYSFDQLIQMAKKVYEQYQ